MAVIWVLFTKLKFSGIQLRSTSLNEKHNSGILWHNKLGSWKKRMRLKSIVFCSKTGFEGKEKVKKKKKKAWYCHCVKGRN
ncbi:hypothetical protein NC651_026969 [Populus alba x Populus x berolinensis]|nr:hypothetical protein NC651_026969 [Populus alba x Populus x berolinensis]